MVMTHHGGRGRSRQRASLMIELVAAMALLTGALLPVAYSLAAERRLARSSYQRAIAMEIIDGEAEALAAGEWHAFAPGSQEYTIRAGAATNLPPGKLTLHLEPGKARLVWQPAAKHQGGAISREVMLK